jgi:hypothetical protein
VPPGEYRLAYELAGFQSSVRDGLRVTLGTNTQINLVLNVATLQESVTVSGASPVIDTSATRVQTNYDQQMLSSLPNARDMWSLLATTPSVTLNRVDVGGSTMGTQTTYFAYGYSGQNRPLVEGINTTEGTAAAGLLPRLRIVRGSLHRRGRQLRRDAEPRRAHAVCQQERRQHTVGELLLRLREREIPVQEPGRRSGHPLDRRDEFARTATVSRATRTSTSVSAARSSRTRCGASTPT